jgi:peroxiredoxin
MNVFNERLDELLDLGISMIGINNDSMDSHKGFKKMIGLKWELLFDCDKNVAKSYGAIVGPGHMVTGFTNREFILIDRDMRAKYIWRAEVPKDLPVFDDVLNGVKVALQ